MEELLNKLIEKGWKPRWNQPEESLKKKLKVERYNRKPVTIVIKRPRRFIDEYYSFRELFSKESWLWQFVCKNGMTKSETWVWVNAVDGMYKEILINQYDYRYRLIESSLKDESELEEFLLQNIKING